MNWPTFITELKGNYWLEHLVRNKVQTWQNTAVKCKKVKCLLISQCKYFKSKKGMWNLQLSRFKWKKVLCPSVPERWCEEFSDAQTPYYSMQLLHYSDIKSRFSIVRYFITAFHKILCSLKIYGMVIFPVKILCLIVTFYFVKKKMKPGFQDNKMYIWKVQIISKSFVNLLPRTPYSILHVRQITFYASLSLFTT